MAIAAGIDLGGTKIEAQVFAPDWSVVDRKRIATPAGYDALVAAVADQIAWATDLAGGPLPVGIGAAGLVHPQSGLTLTANIAAKSKPFPADIAKAVGHPVTYLNDCRAFTLSEAHFGAGRGHRNVVGIIFGTGIGGGVAIDQQLVEGPSGFAGEFGHLPLPAELVARHALPVRRCGCGRVGCVETLVAGPGIAALAEQVTGRAIAAPDIAATRATDPDAAKVWSIWLDLAADLLRTITLHTDPDVILLGGGLSKIAGIAPDLQSALQAQMWDGYTAPQVLLAEGGDTSGARGAAFAAWRDSQ